MILEKRATSCTRPPLALEASKICCCGSVEATITARRQLHVQPNAFELTKQVKAGPPPLHTTFVHAQSWDTGLLSKPAVMASFRAAEACPQADNPSQPGLRIAQYQNADCLALSMVRANACIAHSGGPPKARETGDQQKCELRELRDGQHLTCQLPAVTDAMACLEARRTEQPNDLMSFS